MVVVLFRNRPRPDGVVTDYGPAAGKLLGIVSKMPGFVSVDVFNNDGGESLILAKFESEEAVAQWRENADHKAAQGRREDFYDEYTVQICSVIRAYGWQRNDAK